MDISPKQLGAMFLSGLLTVVIVNMVYVRLQPLAAENGVFHQVWINLIAEGGAALGWRVPGVATVGLILIYTFLGDS